MESTLSPNKTASAIWGRVVKPDRGTLTPEVARAILKLDFDPEDRERINRLSAKAQKGSLSAEERAELEGVCQGQRRTDRPPIEGPIVAQAGESLAMKADVERLVRAGPTIAANTAGSPNRPRRAPTRSITSSPSSMKRTTTHRTSRSRASTAISTRARTSPGSTQRPGS